MNQPSLPMNQHVTTPTLSRAASLALLLCCLLAVYFSTVQSLLDRWNQSGSEYGHGPLLVGVIVWLIFRERHRLLRADIKPCYWALLLAGLLSMLWSAGYITQVNVVQQVALPCVIFFSVIALLGIPVARILWFPLSLIVFAIPVWNVLQPPLQDLAVAACGQLFSFINIPVHISGNAITVTSGTFQVATGCSGLNLFLAATLLGILFAHLHFTERRDQFIVVLLALLLGIVCNWVRIATIIWIAQLSDDINHPIVQDHGWLGWAWFTLLFAGYLFFVNRLPFAVKDAHSNSNPLHQTGQQSASKRVSIAALLACMLGVYSAPLLSIYLPNRNSPAPLPIVAPATVLGYPARAIGDTTSWRPNFHATTSELHIRLETNSEPLDFHLYFYATQRQETELIHFDNTIADDKNWHVVRFLNQGSSSENHWWRDVIVESHGLNSRRSLLVRYWYSIAGSNTTNPTIAKLLQLKGFIHNRTDASLIAINTACSEPDCHKAQKSLDAITKSASLEAKNIINPLVN